MSSKTPTRCAITDHPPVRSTSPGRMHRAVRWLFISLLIAASVPLPARGSANAEENEDMSWKQSVLSHARRSLGNVEEFADVQWRRFANEMGFHEPRHIAAYHGYGNGTHIWIRGRLLANKPTGGPDEDDDWWDNLQATYQRWESNEVPNAAITLQYGDTVQEVITDKEGYYEARFEVDPDRPRTDVIIARHDLGDGVLTATHRVFLPHADAEFMIISDMDDTVIHTGITNMLVAAQLTFLHNAKTRKPLTGVGGLYRSLAAGTQSRPVNPVFYVSNSAWNMYDLLRDFIDLNDLPDGPLLLRDIGLNADTDDHKITSIRHIMSRHDHLPAILVGDSGQHDAEIYARIAKEFPGRVQAIYIRDVDPEEKSDYDGQVDAIIADSSGDVPFLRVADSSEIAHHATRIGLLPGSEVDDVERDVEVDRNRESLAESVVGDSEAAL